jgi:putative membrane protein
VTPQAGSQAASASGVARLLVAWGINVLGLIVVDGLFDGIDIRRWGPVVLGGAVLGIANTVVRPLVALLTLPLIVLTLGIGYFAISVGMLALAEWVSPDFSVDGFWTYVGATVILSLVNAVIGRLLGVRASKKMSVHRLPRR